MAEFIYTLRKARKAHGDKVVLDDVTQGDNQVPVLGPDFINTPACCSAYVGYDQASGLGAPLFDRLASSLPKPE